MIRRAILILIGVFALISWAGASNIHRTARHFHHARVAHAEGPAKTCMRYYGGPKGGLWPGPC